MIHPRRFKIVALLVGVFCVGFVLGAAALSGYVIARWDKLSEEWEHSKFENEARAYLDCLDALTARNTNAFRRIQGRGHAVFKGYVRNVDQLKKRGYEWAPLSSEVYERALKHLSTTTVKPDTKPGPD